MNFCVATNWDTNLHKYFFELNANHKKDKIDYVFASAPFSVFGSATAGTPLLSFREISKKILEIKKGGIKFDYLINSTIFPDLTKKEDFNKAIKYFIWTTKQNVDIITIGNTKLLDFVYRNFSSLKINISIAMGIKKIEEVNRLREKYPNIERITLHQTLNRDKNALIRHIKNVHDNVKLKPIKIELLANEICLYNCPLMKKHYATLSRVTQGHKFEYNKKIWEWCGNFRAKNVKEFLSACWIRPEDVQLYEDLGVDYIKIAGRRESTKNLKLRAAAYMNRFYDGNVMDLFMSEFWPNNKPPFINNRDLDGYIEKVFQGKNIKSNIEYKW